MKFFSETVDINPEDINSEKVGKYNQEVPVDEIENINQKSDDAFQDNDFEAMKRIVEREDQIKEGIEKLIEDISSELYERASRFGLEK